MKVKDAISSMVERLQALGDSSTLIETFVIGDTFKAAHVNLSYPYEPLHAFFGKVDFH